LKRVGSLSSDATTSRVSLSRQGARVSLHSMSQTKHSHCL
jgi:hypothetical protein